MDKLTSKMISFDDNGDVEVELQSATALVSSNALCLSSPVFTRMLQSLFKEGTQLDPKTGARKITLPDDDPDAFLLYYKIIHFRDVPLEPPPATLAALAVLCDKYSCSQAIVIWAHVWQQNYCTKKNASTRDLSNLLILAYVLGLSEAFAKISATIIMSHVGSFASLPFNDHSLTRTNGLAGVFVAGKASHSLDCRLTNVAYDRSIRRAPHGDQHLSRRDDHIDTLRPWNVLL